MLCDPSARPRKGAPNRRPVSAHLSFIGVTCGSRNDSKTAADPESPQHRQQPSGAGNLEHTSQAGQQIAFPGSSVGLSLSRGGSSESLLSHPYCFYTLGWQRHPRNFPEEKCFTSLFKVLCVLRGWKVLSSAEAGR